MTGNTSQRVGSLAALLAVALLATAALGSVALAADAESDTEAASETTLEATPEPTPYLAFDPGDVAVRIDLFADGLDAPVFLTDDGTDRKPENDCLYVVERGGTVRVVESDGTVRGSTPFLDISERVKVGAEQGLHAIAFHPKFKKNGRFFAHYNDTKGRTVIDEFKGKACGKASAKPVKNLLTEVQELPNNNGGWIGFAPDGRPNLYIALGDGGGVSPGDPKGNGQTKSTRLSKILRIDVDRGRRYEIPKDNPYAKKAKGFPREAWAMGLRNPRRASFDRETGDLWIGDPGQDRFEEINVIPAGSVPKNGPIPNFGWSDMEGDSCHRLADCDPSMYTLPLWFYDQVAPHGGVTGGYVYRGAENPKLDGVYLFSDVISGFIWGIDADAVAAGEPPVAHALLDAAQGFVSFGEDAAGELYLVSLDGSIFRISAEAT